MEDTIAAVATPYGEGGIGIIRVSGNKAGSILNMIFRPLKYQNATQIENRRLVYGHIVDSKTGIVVDEVLAVFMKAPHTYTAEDVAEIHCHGGQVLSQLDEVSQCSGYGAASETDRRHHPGV